MARKRTSGWFGREKKRKGYFSGKKSTRGAFSSPISFGKGNLYNQFGKKKKAKRDLIDRAFKRVEKQMQAKDDQRAGIIARLLTALNRERTPFQPPMVVVETDANGLPQSAPVVEARPSVQQLIEDFFKGIFRRS